MFRKPQALAGFAAGILACIILAAAVGVIFQGEGLSDRDNGSGDAVVYPNF